MKFKPLPNLERVKELLNYNSDTGEFRWKITISRNKQDGKAGYLRYDGYTRIAIDGKSYYANRLAWFIVTGNDPLYFDIDHKDGNKSNNKFDNLRLATKSQNQMNKRKTTSNKSGFKGVHKEGNRWRACIYINKKRISLGSYSTKEEAYESYKKAAEKYHGEFKHIG